MILLLSVQVILPGPSAAQEIDLSLSDAITRALDYNFGIKASVFDSAAANSVHQEALAARLPTLSLDTRTGLVDNIPEADFGFKKIELGMKETYQADFKLSLPLFTGGKITSSIRIARENILAEKAVLESERLVTAFDCRKAYLQLLLTDASLKIAKASKERISIIRQNVQNMYETGLADSIDILEAALAVEQVKENLDRQEANYRIALNSLRNLTGLDSRTVVNVTEVAQPLTEPRYSSKEDLQINRPELKQLQHLVQLAEHSVSSSQADYFPTLSGYAGYSVGKPNRDMFNKDWDSYFNCGLTLNWRFNLGRQTLRRTEAARQQAEAAKAKYSDMRNNLDLLTESAFENLGHALNLISITAREFDIAGRRFKLAEDKQKAGRLTINRLLEMEADLTATEQRYQSIIIQYYLAETELLYAIGSPKIFGGL